MRTGPDLLPGVRRLPAGPLVAGVSGGLDSLVLLHQLRFGANRGGDVLAVHVDHGMRPSSAADALWLRGVCRAWQVEMEVRRLPVAPTSEEEARQGRHQILETAARRIGAVGVVLAHHADDQAETVLFRALRGTGVAGLRGMEARRGHRLRPLLELWRQELEAYAARHRVPWRDDPSNRDLAFARNVIRHEVLPRAEAGVAPRARRALVRLAENAGAARAELAAFDAVLLDPLLREVQPGRIEFDAASVAELPRPLRARLLRRGAVRLGRTLSRRSTELAVDALARFHPGRGLDLSGGLRLERGLEGWILLHPSVRPGWRAMATAATSASPGDDRRGRPTGANAAATGVPGEWALGTDEAGTPGRARVELGRWRYTLRWSREHPEGAGDLVALRHGAHLPLRVRGWRPGDRIRTGSGSRPVAKLLAEAGVSALDRPAAAVAVGPEDRVLWVPGRGRAAGMTPAEALREGPPSEDVDWLFVTCTRTWA